MEWGYINATPRTLVHIPFYKHNGITFIQKNDKIYVRGSKFIETLRISTRSIGKQRRLERLMRDQCLLTYRTRVVFDGKKTLYGIIAARALGAASALMVNPLENWAEVLPSGLLGFEF